MLEIELDGRRMDNRAKAHAYLRQQLQLPAHYGNNLDALADCLSELSGYDVVFIHSNAMLNALGAYGQKMLRVFQEASLGRRDFRFRADGADR